MTRLALTEAQLTLVKENFRLLDTDGDGRLTLDQCVVLTRALGQTQTTAELRNKLTAFLRKDPTDPRTNETYMGPTTFLAAFDALFREPLSVRTLSEALTLLDTSNSGKISPQDLRAALTQGGDALSSADAAAVIDMLGLDRPARVRDIANQWVRRQQQTDFSRDQEHEEYPVTH